MPPTALPTGEPTGGQPTAGCRPAAWPRLSRPAGVGVTQILDELTGGPTPLLPLPSVDVTQLLGGVGSALPTPITDLLP